MAENASVADLKASIAAARSDLGPAGRLRILCNGKELADSALLSAEVLPSLRGATVSNRYVVVEPFSPVVTTSASAELLVPSRKQSKKRRPSFAARLEQPTTPPAAATTF